MQETITDEIFFEIISDYIKQTLKNCKLKNLKNRQQEFPYFGQKSEQTIFEMASLLSSVVSEAYSLLKTVDNGSNKKWLITGAKSSGKSGFCLLATFHK